MAWIRAALSLVLARASNRPGRWLLTGLGIGLGIAFAGAVVAEATVAADRSARTVLAALSPLDRAVRITSQDVVTPRVEHDAVAALDALGLTRATEVALLNPVRLGGVIVRPAAITPLAPSITTTPPATTSSCDTAACPMLTTSGAVRATRLTAPGVRITVVGSTRLRSAAALGFLPGSGTDAGPPVVIGGDAAGLEALPALSSVYRTHSWVAELAVKRLHSWQLAATEQRLRQAQATLGSGALELAAPFAGLDAARAQADAAPRRLLLAGGGALAALALFVVLAAGGLRRDLGEELGRLRSAGARTEQCVAFVVIETALLSGVAAVVGAGTAVGSAALLADAAGLPVGGVLEHSLLTPAAIGGLAVAWLVATALLSVCVLSRGSRVADVVAVAAATSVAFALWRGAAVPGNDPLPVLLAPLCCLAAGVLVYRAAAIVLRAGARVASRAPVLGRLALIGLARAPAAPSLAIAFIAVSTGLGGFALAYRATLLRSTRDQAANEVPLDAIVAAGPDLTTPLALASPHRWQTLAGGGEVFGVLRTDATFLSGGATTTVPALGVPTAALTLIHGWRSGDGSAPIRALAGRLRTSGRSRTPGPLLPATARTLAIMASAKGGVMLFADLRDSRGRVTQAQLGEATAHPSTLRARVPPGNWELEGLALQQPAGLEATNGHQNGENPAAATQQTTTVSLSAVRAEDSSRRTIASEPLSGWHAVGAAGAAQPAGGNLTLSFAGTGEPGLVRPLQPSDLRPLPVLVDPLTAATAGRGGLLALTVDGEPLTARVVGTLRRFPTIASGAGGFVVADEPSLAGALDGQLPGLGQPSELWVSSHHPASLRAALASAPLSQLSLLVRSEVERQLRSAPIASGVLGTLEAATLLAGTLAVLGLLVALLGGVRDERVERDLIAQGVGPRALRRELELRLLLAAALGVAVGLVVAALLTRLAVQSVQAASTLAAAQPPLVAVAPWLALAIWAAVSLVAFAGAGWVAARVTVARRVLA
jgi:hypothetical protein